MAADGGGDAVGTNLTIARDGLQTLIAVLRADGREVVGPTVRDGAIIYDAIADIADLPAGWTDRQEAGRYRLERRADDALFGYTVGPHAWKRFLFPPSETLWTMRRAGDAATVAGGAAPAPRYAFIGARSCELHAIAIQDKVFVGGPFPDTGYRARRANVFIVAVNCGQAGNTCFCVSMQTGPKAEAGYDLVLTELLDDARHDFLVAIGSEAGADIMRQVPHRPATADDLSAADAALARAAAGMGRHLETQGLKQALQAAPGHRRWDEVAARCLTCGNCTMVCPTCFCTTVRDHTDLAGSSASRVREWDSCFTLDFSSIHGGSVRRAPRARYRQWLTHKLANWIDQFGTSGCVGCGRCITWCPVGIDITEEAAAIAAAPAAAWEAHHEGA